jgi:hypothetical protein
MRSNLMRILVHEIVSAPASTIGYGAGIDSADGRLLVFCGDHRSMADIRTALDQQADVPVFAMLEDWQVIGGDLGQ